MRYGSKTEIGYLLERLPRCHRSRYPICWNDWGDKETRLLAIRRCKNKTNQLFTLDKCDENYGIFLGKMDGEYFVGVQDIRYPELRFLYCEVYSSKKQMQDDWRLR